MDRKDLKLEQLHVSKPVRLAFHCLDLVICPLHRAARNHHIVVGQQSRAVHCQRFGHLLEYLDSRCLRSVNPAVQERSRKRLPWLVPKPLQIVLQIVGRCQRLIQGQCFL